MGLPVSSWLVLAAMRWGTAIHGPAGQMPIPVLKGCPVVAERFDGGIAMVTCIDVSH